VKKEKKRKKNRKRLNRSFSFFTYRYKEYKKLLSWAFLSPASNGHCLHSFAWKTSLLSDCSLINHQLCRACHAHTGQYL